MIDIHCHIIPGVDDGPQATQEASQMLCEAAKVGVRTIIATPHYSRELYENGLARQRFEYISKEAARYGLDILYGYEIKIHTYPARMPTDFSGLTLGGTEYILLELPLDNVPSYTVELLYKIQLQKLIPILAHPERCSKLLKDKLLFADIVDMGCLLQVDASSILGRNGGAAKRFARRIIASGQAAFVASDAHDPAGYSKWFVNAYKKVVKWVGSRKADGLFRNNARVLIEKAKPVHEAPFDHEMS